MATDPVLDAIHKALPFSDVPDAVAPAAKKLGQDISGAFRKLDETVRSFDGNASGGPAPVARPTNPPPPSAVTPGIAEASPVNPEPEQQHILPSEALEAYENERGRTHFADKAGGGGEQEILVPVTNTVTNTKRTIQTDEEKEFFKEYDDIQAQKLEAAIADGELAKAKFAIEADIADQKATELERQRVEKEELKQKIFQREEQARRESEELFQKAKNFEFQDYFAKKGTAAQLVGTLGTLFSARANEIRGVVGPNAARERMQKLIEDDFKAQETRLNNIVRLYEKRGQDASELYERGIRMIDASNRAAVESLEAMAEARIKRLNLTEGAAKQVRDAILAIKSEANEKHLARAKELAPVRETITTKQHIKMKQQTGEPGLELVKPEDRYRTGVVMGLDGQTVGFARTEEAEKLNERTRDVAQLNRSINRIKELMKQGKGVSEKARMDAVSMISKMQAKDYFKTGALDADTLLAMNAMLGDAGAWTDVTSIDRMEEMQKILNDSVVTGLKFSGMDPMSDKLKAQLMSRSAVMSQPATERDRQRFKMAEQVLRNPGQYGEQAVAAAKRTLGIR